MNYYGSYAHYTTIMQVWLKKMVAVFSLLRTEDVYTDDLLDPELLQDEQLYPT